MSAPSLTVIGAGAFGTALALAEAAAGRAVTLWGRDRATMARMAQTRANPRLPGVMLPASVRPTADPADLGAEGIAILAVPMQALAGFLADHGARIGARALVAACKGIDLQSLRGPVEVISRALPDRPAAVLTGPSFAADIARGLPTALTLAADAEEVALWLQQALATPRLRLYRSLDVTGVELGGALKNVIAIAAGIVIGAGLGESARAALVTRGHAEIARLAVALGARQETLMGLAGFGDLVLTCTSAKSRNFRHGLALGRGQTPDPAETVEGVATARAARALAETHGLEVPVIATVADIIEGRTGVEEAATALLSRPLREE